jgi:SAM-dependent methyltransferase
MTSRRACPMMQAALEEDSVAAPQTMDGEQIEEFVGKLMSIYTGSMLSYMIDIGDRTGLFEAAARSPATSKELADRAGLEERYVREWLGSLVAGGIFEYDPATRAYTLPPAPLACLTAGPVNLAPIARMNTLLGKHVHQVARAFREGGGVPYAEFRPEFTDAMDAIGRDAYDSFLLDAYVPLVPGLAEKLRTGARVADVACGTGHALVVLARAFPASSFVGYDLDEGAIARARAEAEGAGLQNVRFETCDVARLAVREPFDAVFVFDAIHDQVDPTTVLARIHAALRDGGSFFMKEPHAADTLEENAMNPMAAVQYALSTLHCMTVSLAHDGAGIGTAFGEGMARRMLTDAGFVDVAVHSAPADPMDAIYISRKPSASS